MTNNSFHPPTSNLKGNMEFIDDRAAAVKYSENMDTNDEAKLANKNDGNGEMDDNNEINKMGNQQPIKVFFKTKISHIYYIYSRIHTIRIHQQNKNHVK